MSGSWWIFCLTILVLFIVSLATGIIGRINRNTQPDLNWFLQSDESKLSALNHGATGAILKVGRELWRHVLALLSTSYSPQTLTSLKILEYILDTKATQIHNGPQQKYYVNNHYVDIGCPLQFNKL